MWSWLLAALPKPGIFWESVSQSREAHLYAQYTKTSLNNPMFAVLLDDVSSLEGASVFVNPLTVLGFIHTTKQEGHKAIVHNAAASQLGRMLVKQCKEEGIPLVKTV